MNEEVTKMLITVTLFVKVRCYINPPLPVVIRQNQLPVSVKYHLYMKPRSYVTNPQSDVVIILAV